MNRTEWIYCPICGNKTRTMIREDTELKNFPVALSKMQKGTLINAKNRKVLLLRNKKQDLS